MNFLKKVTFISKSNSFIWTKRSIRRKSTYYITTPIFYVNAEPHIGHLYTALIGDAVSRHQQLTNSQVKYLTGTDEHGTKIHQASQNRNTPVLEYCNQISDKYRELFKIFNISYHDYIRTTDGRHATAVRHIWNVLHKKGFIYQGEYSGWYCVADETFIPDSQLEPEFRADGKRYTLEGGKLVDFVREENYKFKLSHFKNDLLHWLKKDIVKPAKFQKMLIEWIIEGSAMNDISVSRPRSRVSWGIPVPNDDSQTIYVWLDALVSYLTSDGYPNAFTTWPPDLQIIGKDILKFHGIYWPAFLLAADLDLPRCLLCHSHWVIDNEKMSKSKGNVVNPFEKSTQYTTDGFRYFLLREGVPHSDGNYNEDKIIKILNSELADTLGNLLNRCCAHTVNVKQVFPSFSSSFEKYCTDECQELMNSLYKLPDLVHNHYSEFNFYKGIDAIISTLHLTNKFFEVRKPWELKKQEKNKDHLDTVLHITMESLRVCGILLQPIVPVLSSNLLNKLGISTYERKWEHIRPLSWEKHTSNDVQINDEKVILFQKLVAARS